MIVVGHCADQVRALAATAPSGMTIECIDNPAYQKGSSLSLYCTRDVIRREPTLIMDADVVFPREFLRRLVESPPAPPFLYDERVAGKVACVRCDTQDNRVIALGQKVVPKAWDRVEGIGFFKGGPEAGRELIGLLERVIEDSQGSANGDAAPPGEPAARRGRGGHRVPWTGSRLRGRSAPG
jgi:choline kinase